MPSAEEKRRLYWRAVYALREAEAITKLGDVVGEETDEPPKAGQEQSWTDKWATRAKKNLAKAWDWWTSGNEKLRDRAKSVADRVKEGVRAIKKANPLSGASRKVQDLQDAANSISMAIFFGEVVVTGLLVWAAWEFFFKNKGRA